MKERELYFDEEKEIKELLLYRKIIEVKDDTLILDNGVELTIIPNEGCGGCNAGWYHLAELNGCDNAITDVQFEESYTNDGDQSYKIFVLAEDKRIMLANIEGDDGSGYYGTGYRIIVKMNK